MEAGFLYFILLVLLVVALFKLGNLRKRIDELRQEQNVILDILRRLATPPIPADEQPQEELTPQPATEPPPMPPPLPATPPEVVEEEVPEQPDNLSEDEEFIPAEPPAPSRIGQILRRIWEWFLVGDDFRRPGTTAEFAIASTWLLRTGIIVIVACVGWFLKWSLDRDLMGPMGRTAMAMLAGLGMLIAGYRLLGKRYHLMGQGLFGGGLATLYFSVFAAGPLYDLVPLWTAFLLMILVTVAAGVLSIRVDSMLIAILGIIGGFCTPVMLGTGEANFAVLYSYLFLLGVGILILTHYKSWRLLNYLGFMFTWLLVLGSLFDYQRADFAVVLSLTAILFVLHTSIVYWHNVIRRETCTVLEVVYLIINAIIFPALAYGLIISAHGRPWPAVLTLLLSAFYTAHVFILMKLRRGDRILLITLIALAGFYLTLTIPLLAEKESITIGWALLAWMFLWLSHKVSSPFLRTLSGILYALVLYRLTALDLTRQFASDREAADFSAYWPLLKERLWTFGICTASLFGAFRIEQQYDASSSTSQEEESPQGGLGAYLRPAFYWIGVVVFFVYLQLEVAAMFTLFPAWRLSMMTVVWCATGAYFLFRYLRTGAWSAFWAAGVFLVIAACKIISTDLTFWEVNIRGVYMADYGVVPVLARLLDFGAVVAMLLLAWRLLLRREEDRSSAALYGYGGLVMLFLYTTLELNAFLFWKLRDLQAGGISILWALYAVAFVWSGIRCQLRPLRFAGLALFSVVVVKVFLIDLVHTPAVYRVLAFLLVGIALLAGAFAYVRAATRNQDPEESE